MPDDPDKLMTSDSLERERLDAEKSFREQEILLKERDQVVREAEFELKKNEQASSRWSNPLVLAIIAAAVAAAGNAAIALVNGVYLRALEEQKSEQTRILEMIKTGSPDKGAENLRFLLDAGLVTDPRIGVKLGEFLAKRKPGRGPTLPAAVPGGKKGKYYLTNVDNVQWEKVKDQLGEPDFNPIPDPGSSLLDRTPVYENATIIFHTERRQITEERKVRFVEVVTKVEIAK